MKGEIEGSCLDHFRQLPAGDKTNFDFPFGRVVFYRNQPGGVESIHDVVESSHIGSIGAQRFDRGGAKAGLLD